METSGRLWFRDAWPWRLWNERSEALAKTSPLLSHYLSLLRVSSNAGAMCAWNFFSNVTATMGLVSRETAYLAKESSMTGRRMGIRSGGPDRVALEPSRGTKPPGFT